MRPLRALHATLFVTLFVPAAASAQGPGSTISTDRIFDAIGVREGITVCEIGAGSGELTIEAARIVGPKGRVYTTELGEEQLDRLQRAVTDSGLSQITVVTGDPAKANLPDAACDALFMRNVYHHFADPGSMNASIAAAMKPGARLAVVDFVPPGEEAGSPAERDEDGRHGITADTLARELQDAGFERVLSDRGARRWFMIVVSKPAG